MGQGLIRCAIGFLFFFFPSTFPETVLAEPPSVPKLGPLELVSHPHPARVHVNEWGCIQNNWIIFSKGARHMAHVVGLESHTHVMHA
jgi:hypothetical protein